MAFINRRVTLVTQATPDYSTNDLCGGLAEFLMRTPGGGGKLVRLAVRSKDSFSGVASKLVLFDAEPASSTLTENATAAIHANDKAKILASVAIAAADWVDLTGIGGDYIVEKALDIPFLFAAGVRTIYSALIPAATLNLSATDSLEVQLGAEVD